MQANRKRAALRATLSVMLRATVLVAGACALQACTQSASVAQSATACAQIDAAGVAALFERWDDALEHKPASAVARLYADDAVLLPTMSDVPRYSLSARIDYFEHFQAKHPAGRIDERRIFIDCNSAVDTGLYTFTYDDGTATHARYTYTCAFQDGAWRITSHHSSAMPEARAGTRAAHAQASRKP